MWEVKDGQCNCVETHFSLLEETDKIGLRNNPKATFNYNESMVAMNRQAGTVVVVSRKTKHKYSESKGTRDHITINTCVSASRFIVSPHTIFSQAYSSGAYAQDGPDGALYSISDNGYMDSGLFYSTYKGYTRTKVTYT